MPDPNALRILSVIAFVVLFILGIKRPVYAVGAYMILVYCKLSSYYPVFGAIKSELIFAFIIILRLAITPNFFTNLSLRYNQVNKYLVYFTLCVGLSFSIAMDHQYSWDIKVYHYIKVLILYVMIITAINSEKELKIFAFVFLSMMAFLAYEPFYYFTSGTGGRTYTYGTNYVAQIGILAGHVALANNMNQMIPIAYFLILSKAPKKQKVFYIAFLIIFVAALIGSGSRGGVLGFVFFLFIVFFLSQKQNKKMAYATMVIAAVFVISSSAFLSTMSRLSSGSAGGRLVGLTHGIGMLKKGNILGAGPGCYILARYKYFSYYMESHNLYGQLLGDLGIPGTIAWFIFLRQIFRNLIPASKMETVETPEGRFIKYLAIGIAASLVVRLFISMASHGAYYFYWYVLAAMSTKINELHNRISETN